MTNCLRRSLLGVMWHRLCVVAVVLSMAAVATTYAAEGKRFAVLAGVEQYDHNKLPPLEYAEDDVRDLAAVLGKVGYRVKLLTAATGKDAPELLPTKANVDAALQGVFEQVTRNDTVLVTLSGHGIHFGGPAADSYFCPQDAKPLADRTDTLVSLSKIYQQLDDSGAGVKVLLVDACRNDPDPARGRGKGVDADTAPRPPSGVAVLFSCSSGEQSYEHSQFKHGVFTHFLLEGLKGKAKDSDDEVSFDTLATYVRKQTAREVPKLIGNGRQQSPNLKADLSGVPAVLLTSSDLRKLGVLGGAGSPRPMPTPMPEDPPAGAGEAVVNTLGMRLVLIPAGDFEMGSNDGNADEQPVHTVRISKAFRLGAHEVTLGEFQKFQQAIGYKTNAETLGGGTGWDGKDFGKHKSYFFANWGHEKQTADHPVVNISWNDAFAFCKWLSKQEGKTYRLPTEAEWEYACRAGTTTAYNLGDDEAALLQAGNVADATLKSKMADWTTADASDGQFLTAKVGTFKPNAFGLFDMHGNAWEWCSDWYADDAYASAGAADPPGPDAGAQRVLRGGGWSTPPRDCRTAGREFAAPAVADARRGFRVVCEE